MRILVAMAAVMLSVMGCSNSDSQRSEAAADAPKLMRWDTFNALPVAGPTHQISYGDNAAQIVDVWLPEGAGPHPVVLIVHGGCWQKSYADRTQLSLAADALRQRGLAVWNIEYRGVDEAGGGYPGTYLDVAAAADALRTAPEAFNLNTDRVVAYGHSAGGHLAAWLGARVNLPNDSPLANDAPMPLLAVINSGGLVDLEASKQKIADCKVRLTPTLTGPPSETRPDVFSDTSPARLQPISVKQYNVYGSDDYIALPELGAAYTALVKDKGGQAEFIEIQDTGHVELILPGTQAFERQAALLESLLAEQ